MNRHLETILVQKYCKNCSVHSDSNEPAKHVFNEHGADIIKECVRGAFVQRHPSLDPRLRGKYSDSKIDSEQFEDQRWKKTSKGFDAVHVIEWLVDMSSVSK